LSDNEPSGLELLHLFIFSHRRRFAQKVLAQELLQTEKVIK
jgi:hypothetical protein